jgi:cupin 2 domain-containing protein
VSANLFGGLPERGEDESFESILSRPGLRIERIVSYGHATPPDRLYEQDEDEWVLLLAGAARLWLDGEGEATLAPGDHLLIPAHRRHRVTWTSPGVPTIWLAVHFGA